MWVLLALLLAVPAAAACPRGADEYEGVCAALPSPDTATLAPIIGSNEKPPAGKMPSYEREGVHADMPQSTAVQDIHLDQEKADAEAQGKKAAGIK